MVVLKGLVVALPLCFVSMPGWADNCSGTDTLITQGFDTVDLGKGLKQTVWVAQSVVMSADSIYKLVIGQCSATILATEDGKTQSSGFCARHDKDGDTQAISTRQAAGADKIEWKSTGGTGKYAGRQDSGWAQPLYGEDNIIITKWGGDCK